jgi:hypothetical protein
VDLWRSPEAEWIWAALFDLFRWVMGLCAFGSDNVAFVILPICYAS